MRKVVLEDERNVITVDETTTEKGYVMAGDKGNFVLAKNTDGKFIWVRVTPSKTSSKPVHSYDSMKDAIKAKLEKGYEVFEYSEASFE